MGRSFMEQTKTSEQRDNKSVSDEVNPPQSKNYRRYVLFLLTIVYALNFVDRQILVILQESIKADMALSDAQLGLLTGFAFAIFYVSVGIPIARWADSGNRKNIVAGAIAVWSGMTALSGLTQNFYQLLLARIGVGVGEAGGSPPSHSILSDYYPAKERGRAMAIYSTGVYLGILIGFIVGGWVNEHYGWRIAFFAVGLPGLLVALIVKFTLREPIRGIADGIEVKTSVTFKETLSILWALKSFRYFALASGLTAFCSYGIGNFLPSFLIRSHGFETTQVGISLAITAGLGGIIGTYAGGHFADKLGLKDMRWYLWVPAIPAIFAPLLITSAMFMDDSTLALACLFVSTVFGALYLGPVIAITHTLVSPNMRAMSSAILFLVLNLIGLGCGPLVVGLISDALTPSLGSDALRYAIAGVSFVGLLSMLAFYRAAKYLPEDLAKQQANAS
ncbi:MAG: putative MFS family arabinose efflux permease [Oleispira sp.]|jgi:predicted MFS family arabinose efflux permease